MCLKLQNNCVLQNSQCKFLKWVASATTSDSKLRPSHSKIKFAPIRLFSVSLHKIFINGNQE